jgi:hypothetical protein
MPAASSFDYAIIRVVPCVEREEFMNVGVILFCRARQFLDARVTLDKTRLQALSPSVDVEKIKKHLDLIPRICAGNGGPVGQLSQPERFHWLVNPRSTSIQVSPVHTGICTDPAAMLDHLMETMVLTSDGQ